MPFWQIRCNSRAAVLVLVWRHWNEQRWPVNFKILPGFRPPQNRSFNMKVCRAILIGYYSVICTIWTYIVESVLYWKPVLDETPQASSSKRGFNMIRMSTIYFPIVHNYYLVLCTIWTYIAWVGIVLKTRFGRDATGVESNTGFQNDTDEYNIFPYCT